MGFSIIGGGDGGSTIGNPVAGGTPGSVLFVDGAGNLGQDNANLYWDDVNNVLLVGGSTSAQGDAAFEVISGGNRGLMPPKMTTTQMQNSMSAFSGIDGLLVYDTTLSKPFYVDEFTPSQASWYSYESVTIAFGRNGNSDGVYLRYGGNATNAGTGWVAPHTGEIKEVTAIETGGNPTKAIDIERYNSAGVLQSTTTINLVGSQYSNLNQNIPFNAGDRINVFVQAVGVPARNLAITMQAKWKHIIFV